MGIAQTWGEQEQTSTKWPPSRNENFKTLQINVTKNHVIPRFVVFSPHETVWGDLYCTRSRSPKKVLFTVKYDIKMKKEKIIVILNVFIKFICFLHSRIMHSSFLSHPE